MQAGTVKRRLQGANFLQNEGRKNWTRMNHKYAHTEQLVERMLPRFGLRFGLGQCVLRHGNGEEERKGDDLR